jgi:hypothetical protein
MDFLPLLPNRSRIVIECDGVQHCADDDGRASPHRYADVVAEDRVLRLRGYEVYRFGGAELLQRAQRTELLTGSSTPWLSGMVDRLRHEQLTLRRSHHLSRRQAR